MLAFFLSLILSLAAFARIEAPVNPVDYEQNPSYISWKKIDTEHFELIFPDEIQEEAQRVAFLLERAYPFVSRSLEVSPLKIPIILQNQSVDSNGFVTLAPRRSEFFMTPTIDPELSNTEWLKTLAIHEFRHVVQFQKTRRGFNKYLEILFGEIGQAAGLALTLPPWFLEGDAVGMETALTHGGRGRLPQFERDLRALLLSGQMYDYDKAHLRSYEDYVPNHYVYGYFLTTHLRNKYGDLFLSRLANQSAETSWNPLSFYNTVDRMSVENFEEFYQEAMRDLVQAWKAQMDKLTPTPYLVKNPERDYGWTNYLYPQVSSQGEILALKRGLSFINHFVLISKDSEETLFYPGILNHEYPYKLRDNRFAFTETDLHPRWGYQDYARLRVYDLKQRDFILTIPHTKWRLATLNHEGEKILAVEWDEKQNQSIIILNMRGEIQERIPFPKNEVITSLDWLNDEEIVMVLKDHDDLKTLVKMNLDQGEISTLIEKTYHNLGYVSVNEGRILLESPVSGIDNIYLVDNGSIQQLTSSRFGAYAPVLYQDKLIYNDYSAIGMNVVEKKLPWKEEQSSSDSFVPFYQKFSQFEGRDNFAARLTEEEKYEVEPYSEFKNALNFHSWIILAPPLSNTITVEAYSRDVLNNYSLSAGAEYNLNERVTQGFVSMTWSHLYPVFDLRLAYGGRSQEFRLGNLELEDRWEEGVAEAGVQVPWKSIVGRMNQSFTLRAFSKLIKVTNKLNIDRTEINDGALFSPGVEFRYQLLSRLAARDLQPPLGLRVSGHFENGRDITGDDQTGTLLSFDSRYFLPGISAHHSFYHQLAYEKQNDNFYQYSSLISFPRGVSSIFLDEFTKYSGNYTLPLFYPDWHWSRYIYLKRVAMNLFYDELQGRYESFDYETSTAGWELLFETHLVRLLLPITIGVRGSYGIKGEREDNYELFLNTGLGIF
jgi:hypothetical protein